MIPGQYAIQVYQGDSYYGPLVTLPSLVPFGGPADLTGSTLAAQIRESKEEDAVVLATFAVNVVDASARQIRLTLTPLQTSTLASGDWDLEVTHTSSGWKGTPLAGKVTVIPEVTRP